MWNVWRNSISFRSFFFHSTIISNKMFAIKWRTTLHEYFQFRQFHVPTNFPSPCPLPSPNPNPNPFQALNYNCTKIPLNCHWKSASDLSSAQLCTYRKWLSKITVTYSLCDWHVHFLCSSCFQVFRFLWNWHSGQENRLRITGFGKWFAYRSFA